MDIEINPLMTAKEFAKLWQDSGYVHRVPDDAKAYVTEHSYSFPIFRQGNFQVEHYIVRPNVTSTKHYHPFEQVIIFLGGTLEGRRGTDLSEESEWRKLEHKDFGRISRALLPTQWHQIRSSDYGFSFYNVQKWPDNMQITSAVVEFRGDLLGPEQQELISKEKGQS